MIPRKGRNNNQVSTEKLWVFVPDSHVLVGDFFIKWNSARVAIASRLFFVWMGLTTSREGEETWLGDTSTAVQATFGPG